MSQSELNNPIVEHNSAKSINFNTFNENSTDGHHLGFTRCTIPYKELKFIMAENG